MQASDLSVCLFLVLKRVSTHFYQPCSSGHRHPYIHTYLHENSIFYFFLFFLFIFPSLTFSSLRRRVKKGKKERSTNREKSGVIIDTCSYLLLPNHPHQTGIPIQIHRASIITSRRSAITNPHPPLLLSEPKDPPSKTKKIIILDLWKIRQSITTLFFFLSEKQFSLINPYNPPFVTRTAPTSYT